MATPRTIVPPMTTLRDELTPRLLDNYGAGSVGGSAGRRTAHSWIDSSPISALVVCSASGAITVITHKPPQEFEAQAAGGTASDAKARKDTSRWASLASAFGGRSRMLAIVVLGGIGVWGLYEIVVAVIR